MNDERHLLSLAITASLLAGEKILEVYQGRNFKIRIKRDLSPITLADRLAHDVISQILEETGIPVLSEEGAKIRYEERSKWHRFWMVDPLDGTKEFINRNDEFTVNIALIEGGVPVMGVIFAPVPDTIYFGQQNQGSGRMSGASRQDAENILLQARTIPHPEGERAYRVIASRSHLNAETREFITNHLIEHPVYEMVSRGSSLKLCMIAEGSADIYPRFGPTMEWDTAAGDAIIRAAGGEVVHTDGSGPLAYNKPDLHNPWFIASLRKKSIG
jgi:3'(2'), 5'-bisphosphate nucleotidase